MPDSIANVAKLASGGRTTPLELLEKNAPGYSLFRQFFATWLKVDITLLASILTVLGIATNALLSLKGVMQKAYYWIYKFFTASISIPGSDRLNREVLNWISANVLTNGGQLILTANTEAINNDAWSYRRARRAGRSDVAHEKRVPINYLPTFGTTWFFWQRRLFLAKRMPSSSSSAMYSNVPAEYADAPEGDEPLVIMCLGRSLDPIKRFLDECRNFADAQRAAHITVRVARSHWDTTILRPMRSFDTVHFDEDVKDSLIQDIDTYLDSRTRQFYNSRGIPYRRGYLLHGPPGTGKTSLSLAIASRFKLDLYLLHLPGIREDSDMERLFASLPPQCVVLLEDIDAVGVRRKREAEDSDDEEGDDDDGANKPPDVMSRCTLSGLLNVLDGVASQEGRIVLMTSNHADKLDPALIRPGRIDKIIYLGNLSQRSAELMFLRMYAPDPNAPPLAGTEAVSQEKLGELASEFSKSIPDKTFTPASVQGYLLGYRHSPTEAARQAGEWAASTKKTMDDAAAKTKRAAARRSRKAKERLVLMAGAMPRMPRLQDEGAESETENASTTVRAVSDSEVSGQKSAGEEQVKAAETEAVKVVEAETPAEQKLNVAEE